MLQVRRTKVTRFLSTVIPDASKDVQEVSSENMWTVQQAFRPLAVLAKLVGCFPTTRIWNGPYGTREWITPVIFLSATIAVIVFNLWDYTEDDGYDDAPAEGGTRKVVAFIFDLFMFTVLMQYILLLVNFKKICLIFNKLVEFDGKLENKVNKSLFFEALGMLLCALVLQVAYSIPVWIAAVGRAESALWNSYLVLRIYTGFFDRIGTFMAIFLSECARKRFSVVSSSIESAIQLLPVTYPFSETERKTMSIKDCTPKHLANGKHKALLDLHGLFQYLCMTVDAISDAFGWILLLEYLRCIVAIVGSGAFLIFSEWIDEYEEPKFCFILEVISASVMLVVMTVIPAGIEVQATSSLPRLDCISLHDLDSECKQQIERLTNRMTRPPRISAAGFFSIERGLLPAVAASIVTYLVIIAQFKGSEKAPKHDNATGNRRSNLNDSWTE